MKREYKALAPATTVLFFANMIRFIESIQEEIPTLSIASPCGQTEEEATPEEFLNAILASSFLDAKELPLSSVRRLERQLFEALKKIEIAGGESGAIPFATLKGIDFD